MPDVPWRGAARAPDDDTITTVTMERCTRGCTRPPRSGPPEPASNPSRLGLAVVASQELSPARPPPSFVRVGFPQVRKAGILAQHPLVEPAVDHAASEAPFLAELGRRDAALLRPFVDGLRL